MENSGKVQKTLGKSLPQILDEMDENIRTVAEAAGRAEEAAKAARQAANVATKASVEAVKRAEMATQVSAGVKRFLVVFEKAVDNYSAYSPDIPGCIATGSTRDEVEKNIREAIAFHIEGLRKDGLPAPEPASSTEYIEV